MAEPEVVISTPAEETSTGDVDMQETEEVVETVTAEDGEGDNAGLDDVESEDTTKATFLE